MFFFKRLDTLFKYKFLRETTTGTQSLSRILRPKMSEDSVLVYNWSDYNTSPELM